MSLSVPQKKCLPALRLVWILLPLQIAYGFYVFFYLRHNGILPPPFYYNAADSFMDFFNTNYWAFQEGRYEEWKSIYPIFVSVLSQLFTSGACHDLPTPFALRECDTKALSFLLASYLAGAAICARLLVSRAERKVPWREWFAWFVVLALGIPGLFALERGNYIVMSFLFLALAARHDGNWKSALFLALAVNIKQYLVILWIVPLLKRRYDLLLLGAVFAILLNILGLILVPDFHYDQVINNMFQFSSSSEFSPFEKLWMPTSLTAWVRVVESMRASQIFIDGDRLEWAHIALTAGQWAERGLCAAAFCLAALQRERLGAGYLSFIVLAGFIAVSDSPGGYSLLLLFPFLSALAARPYGRHMTALFIFICLPLGLAVGPGFSSQVVSFLSGQSVYISLGLPLGAYLRPVLIIMLLAVIVLDLLAIRGEKKSKSRSAGRQSSSPFQV